jgi:solute carrier family 35 (UDP-galactose transporter), member B1
MLMRTVVLGRRESAARYLCVLLITLGVSSFMLLQNQKKGKTGGSSDWLGLAFLALSLAFDGITGPVQERLTHSKEYLPPDSSEMMLWQNFWAAAVMLPISLATGDFRDGVEFMLWVPEAGRLIMMFVAMSAIGQNFVFYLLLRFNSLILSIVTTTRKFFTILASVLRFGHQLNALEWTSVATVFVGLVVDIIFSKGLAAPLLKRIGSLSKIETDSVEVVEGKTPPARGARRRVPKE